MAGEPFRGRRIPVRIGCGAVPCMRWLGGEVGLGGSRADAVRHGPDRRRRGIADLRPDADPCRLRPAAEVAAHGHGFVQVGEVVAICGLAFGGGADRRARASTWPVAGPPGPASDRRRPRTGAAAARSGAAAGLAPLPPQLPGLAPRLPPHAGPRPRSGAAAPDSPPAAAAADRRSPAAPRSRRRPAASRARRAPARPRAQRRTPAVPGVHPRLRLDSRRSRGVDGWRRPPGVPPRRTGPPIARTAGSPPARAAGPTAVRRLGSDPDAGATLRSSSGPPPAGRAGRSMRRTTGRPGQTAGRRLDATSAQTPGAPLAGRLGSGGQADWSDGGQPQWAPAGQYGWVPGAQRAGIRRRTRAAGIPQADGGHPRRPTDRGWPAGWSRGGHAGSAAADHDGETGIAATTDSLAPARAGRPGRPGGKTTGFPAASTAGPIRPRRWTHVGDPPADRQPVLRKRPGLLDRPSHMAATAAQAPPPGPRTGRLGPRRGRGPYRAPGARSQRRWPGDRWAPGPPCRSPRSLPGRPRRPAGPAGRRGRPRPTTGTPRTPRRCR